MTAGDVLRFIDGIAPFSAAEPYDNCGLLIGRPDAPVRGILIALDCTRAAAERAAETGAELIVTHHPVIFDPLKRLDGDSVAFFCAAHGISVISAHTNLDAAAGGVCDTLCGVLGLTRVAVSADGLRYGETEPATPRAFAKKAAAALGCVPRFNPGKTRIEKVAVCSGSGGGFLEEAAALGCDALLTGDVKYSVFIEGANRGITVIDAGHFATERVILPVLRDKISAAFPGAKTEIFDSDPVETLLPGRC